MISHPHDDIEAFALGSLDELSARRVLEHADQCPTCAVLLADAMSSVHAMVPAVARSLAKDIEFGNYARVRGAFGGPWASRPQWVLQTAAAIAAVLLLIVGIQTIRNSGVPTVTVPIAALVHSHFTHHALRGGPGSVKIIQALDGRWLYLVGDGLSPKTRYSLSETVNGSQREVGQFMTARSGEATAYWEQAPARVQAFQVSPVSAFSPILRWP